MKCSDPLCHKPATRELHGIPMCDDYYIEALEHGANMFAPNADARAELWRVIRLSVRAELSREYRAKRRNQ